MILNPHDRQLETLRSYGTLVEMREDWGGALVLCCGEGCALTGVPSAVSIAGGATLAIDADAAAMKSGMRRGEFDFVVNTLDEAMRTLKNEVRQKRALSVGLISEVRPALQEMIERGIQPDLLLIGSSQDAEPLMQDPCVHTLEVAGMPTRFTAWRDKNHPKRHSVVFAGKRRHEYYLPVQSAAELRLLDEKLLALLPVGDIIRRRWIQRVSQYLPEARRNGRWLWLSKSERQRIGD